MYAENSNAYSEHSFLCSLLFTNKQQQPQNPKYVYFEQLLRIVMLTASTLSFYGHPFSLGIHFTESACAGQMTSNSVYFFDLSIYIWAGACDDGYGGICKGLHPKKVQTSNSLNTLNIPK